MSTAVDVRPLEEHVEAMTSSENAYALTCAYGAACSDGWGGVIVADLLCGSPERPVLMTVEQLFHHLHKDIRRVGARHTHNLVQPASREDGGRGPAMAGGPR